HREDLARILVPAPETLHIEHSEPAELAEGHDGVRAHDGVAGMAHAWDAERVGVELPARRDVIHVAGTPTRHDRDVVQVVAALRGLPQTDLHHVTHGTLL